MSKFIDRLKQVSGAEEQPMGFSVKKAAPSKPKMLLIVSVAGTDVGNLAEYTAGADAGLIRPSGSSGVKIIGELSQIVADIPWGCRLKGGSQKEKSLVEEKACDFVVFPAGTSLELFQGAKLGKILELAPSLAEGLLRTVEELPVDAVFIAEEEGGKSFLTWYHLMLFRRFSSLISKPLLVLAPSSVSGSELQNLWQGGVDGVVVEVELQKPPGGIKKLRQVIDKLSFPPKRKRLKTTALLPYSSTKDETVIEEEEEE